MGYETKEEVERYLSDNREVFLGRDTHERGICVIPGCLNHQQSNGADGSYKLTCSHHNRVRYPKMGTNGYEKKNYCENIDGRHGFKCENKLRYMEELEIHHKDGDRSNNDLLNKETLCANCHRIITALQQNRSLVSIR